MTSEVIRKHDKTAVVVNVKKMKQNPPKIGHTRFWLSELALIRIINMNEEATLNSANEPKQLEKDRAEETLNKQRQDTR